MLTDANLSLSLLFNKQTKTLKINNYIFAYNDGKHIYDKSLKDQKINLKLWPTLADWGNGNGEGGLVKN